MKFSKSELDIIYQYAAPTKAETLAGMKSPDSVFPASHSWAASSLGSRI